MTFRDRLVIFARSLSIQGSWNFPQMQGLGFFYSIAPWLRRISGPGYKEACLRHLSYFNTNPYMSPYILGVVARMEEEGRGAEGVKAKTSLMGALGAVGDSYYWATLLPFSILSSMAFSFFWLSLTPILFLFLYNTIQLRNRWSYLDRGYLSAHSPLEGASELNGKTMSARMEASMPPLLGFLLGMGAFGTGTPGTAFLLFGIAFLLFRRKWRIPGVFGVLVVLASLLGFLGVDMRLPWSG